MAKKIRGATALTGGGTGAVDAISGSVLADGDVVMAFAGGQVYPYVVDADSGLSESSPNIIAPDTSPGDKRLILQHFPHEIDALSTYGGGVNYTQATILSALTAIGTVNKTTLLLRPGTWVISTDADYSAYTNVTWEIPPGALLQITSGKKLTMTVPNAGDYQIFSFSGTKPVLFVGNSGRTVNASWFGPVGDGTIGAATGTDDRAALQAAMDSLDNNGHKFRTTPGAVYQLGTDGLGSLYLYADYIDYDFSTSVFLGSVAIGDYLGDMTTIPKYINITGGIYAPVAEVQAAPPPATNRYLAGTNGLAILVGTDIHVSNPTFYPSSGGRGLTIQTSTSWGVTPFANLKRITVDNPIVIGAIDPYVDNINASPLGILVNTAGYDGGIEDVQINNPIVKNCFQGIIVTSGAVSNVLDRISVNNAIIDKASDRGLYVVGVRNGRFSAKIDNVSWQGFCSLGNSMSTFDVSVRGYVTLAVPPGQTGDIAGVITSDPTYTWTGPNIYKSINVQGYDNTTKWAKGIVADSTDDVFADVFLKWCTIGIDNSTKDQVWGNVVVDTVTTVLDSPTDPNFWGKIVDISGSIPVQIRNMLSTANETAIFSQDAALGELINLTAGEVDTIFSAANNFSGLILIYDATGANGAALYLLSVGTSTKIAGAVGWGASAGAASLNVYYDGSTHVSVQNSTGGAIDIRALSIRIAQTGT